MTQRAVDGLPGPRVPWLWSFCLHPSPYTVSGAAQEKPRDHAQPGLQFMTVVMWLPCRPGAPLSDCVSFERLMAYGGSWWRSRC